MADAVAARDGFAAWAASELALPCFLYGPARATRRCPSCGATPGRRAAPTVGRTGPTRRPARSCVGARPVLVAYNVWLAGGDVALARRVASAVRGPAVRALGLAVGDRAQVSA